MTLTERYQQHYLPGFDCRMATFRNNLAYYGSRLSNGMTLGLSGCLSFIYAEPLNNRIPYHTILGITDQTLEGLSSVFDTYLVRGECVFQTEALIAFIKGNLDRNILVNAAINRPLLNHLRAGNSLQDFIVTPTNVGFHFVTITHIENGMITFFETDFGQPIIYDLDTFRHLWFYDTIYGRKIYDAQQMCNGKYYTIQAPGLYAESNKNALLFSIDKVVESFFSESKGYSHGLQAMEQYFHQMRNWDLHQLDGEVLMNSFFFMKILEGNLSGGGFGRRLYSSFLTEVATLFDDATLRAVAREFRATARLWTDFINELCSKMTAASLFKNDHNYLTLLADKYAANLMMSEKQQFENLRTWIQSKS